MSPLSTTTTRRTSCTLATRIPPNYEPGSRFRVLAPDGSEVDVTVPAGAEAGTCTGVDGLEDACCACLCGN